MVVLTLEYQALYFTILTVLRTENILVDAEKAFDQKKKKHIKTTFLSKLGRAENILNLIKRLCKTTQKNKQTKPYRNLHAGYTCVFPL